MKFVRPFLMLATVLIAAAQSSYAQTWTQTTAPLSFWQTIASSADGNKLVAGAQNSQLFISINSGITWKQVTNASFPSDTWASVASSADGTELIAASQNNYNYGIWISHDSGATWTNSGPDIEWAMQWAAVASSADGVKLISAVGEIGGNEGPIYLSTNSGVTWTQANVPSNYWISVASSADGTKLIAASGGVYAGGGPIWTSTNSGTTWTSNNVPILPWRCVASSADGNKLAAVDYYAGIYTSTNAGLNWIRQTNTPLLAVGSDPHGHALASSADGVKLVLGAASSPHPGETVLNTFISTNSGITWMQDSNAPNADWFSLALSADGSRLVAVTRTPGPSGGGGGPIYISQSTPFNQSPQLDIKRANNNSTLSWIIPSTNFVMQQSSDMSSWTDVTNEPELNLTNLQNELVLPQSNSSGFYRLKTRDGL